MRYPIGDNLILASRIEVIRINARLIESHPIARKL